MVQLRIIELTSLSCCFVVSQTDGGTSNICKFELYKLVKTVEFPINIHDRTHETEGMSNILQAV